MNRYWQFYTVVGGTIVFLFGVYARFTTLEADAQTSKDFQATIQPMVLQNQQNVAVLQAQYASISQKLDDLKADLRKLIK